MVRVRHILLGLVAVIAVGCAQDVSAEDETSEDRRPGDDLSAIVGDELADAIRRSSCGDLCAEVSSLRARWAEGVAAVEAAPELGALDAEWPACMAANGFAVTLRTELDELVMNRLEPELSAGLRPSAEQQSSAERLQRRLDGIDAECSAEREQRRTELLVEFEQEFVDVHAAALTRLNPTGQ